MEEYKGKGKGVIGLHNDLVLYRCKSLSLILWLLSLNLNQ